MQANIMAEIHFILILYKVEYSCQEIVITNI